VNSASASCSSIEPRSAISPGSRSLDLLRCHPLDDVGRAVWAAAFSSSSRAAGCRFDSVNDGRLLVVRAGVLLLRLGGSGGIDCPRCGTFNKRHAAACSACSLPLRRDDLKGSQTSINAPTTGLHHRAVLFAFCHFLLRSVLRIGPDGLAREREAEILLLRHQLAVLKRANRRPRLRRRDRMTIAAVARLIRPDRWSGFIATPATIRPRACVASGQACARRGSPSRRRSHRR
jgi:hypothetical protein